MVNGDLFTPVFDSLPRPLMDQLGIFLEMNATGEWALVRIPTIHIIADVYLCKHTKSYVKDVNHMKKNLTELNFRGLNELVQVVENCDPLVPLTWMVV